ncbi:dihydrolipoyl dehydrogenase [Mesorhizobium sp. WSM3626]|uniref:dihydrolipoyl dehydrogenase n=1 Tax=Mesorhizobium sp. WSM3626 TaxID=1040987 RepID=UPI0004897CA4|nr:dihydrolipoyl dehydrogenase [Mesorhizobium sp. WSM3626]
MKEISCKLLVIGAGPAGYVCAIRAGQLGVDTVIVEAGKPGGTCLNVGCIPSKALIHAAEEFEKVSDMAGGKSPLGISVTAPVLDLARTIAWKDGIVSRLNSGVAGLLKKAGVKTVHGWARFRDGKTVEVETETGSQVIRAETIVIATGSAPVELLPFGGPVISSTEALALSEVPKRLAVVGGGYIGLELGMAFAKMGAKVTVVEALPRVLAQYDAELTRPVVKRLAALGVEVMTGAKAKGLSTKGDALLVETSDGKSAKVAADKILVTVGRKPVTEGWGLEQIDLDRAGKFIRIDDQCRTSMRGVFAIGDVTGEPMLAHRAMAQGEMVAEIVAGHKRSWDKRSIPAVCFTDPELVTAGLSPEEAKALGEIKIGLFPFAANGRAMTKLGEDGFVRVVARADNHLVLGIQAVGQGVSELSAAFGLALEMGARLEDIAGTIHAHPTQGEGFQEAALKALGHALHI